MKLKLDDGMLEIEFDAWQIGEAAKVIEKVRHDHRERADNVLKSLLGLLIFGQIESRNPGTLDRLIRESSKVSELLKGPQPSEG